MKTQKGLKDLNQGKKHNHSEKISCEFFGERIEELLSDRIINLESVAELIDQLDNGAEIMEIKGDALNAIVIALKSSINDLKKRIYVIDRTHRVIATDYKHDPSEEKPYLCKGCGKVYSYIDFLTLEDPWGFHPCNTCGSREYTVTARDGIRTTDIGR